MTKAPYKSLVLKKAKEKSLIRRHPWVFSGAFTEIPTDLEDGEKIYVENHKRQILATAYFGTGSIAARILAFGEKTIDLSFYKEKSSKCS